MKTTLRKKLFVVILILAMLVIPLCEPFTPISEAATKAATNKKAKKLYQKKINQIVNDSITGIYYKYADVNRDGITDVLISRRSGSSWELQIYTYNKGKLVQLYDESVRGACEVKAVGYKGGLIVHFSGIDYHSEVDFDIYYYYKKTSAGKYKYVATKDRKEGAKWSYYAENGDNWSNSKAAFNKQVKKVKTGTRKSYGSCLNWNYKSK